jgi:hypothetical protein
MKRSLFLTAILLLCSVIGCADTSAPKAKESFSSKPMGDKVAPPQEAGISP